MPRAGAATIDQMIQDAIAPAVQRVSAAIAKAITAAAEQSLSREFGASMQRAPARRRGRAAAARPRARNVEMTEWTADRRARRVPTFVIEATGLDTKKKIVAKFGENATFQKGKPLPAAKAPSSDRSVPLAAATRQVTAKPPRVRKAATG
jgi:hypothetical protein